MTGRLLMTLFAAAWTRAEVTAFMAAATKVAALVLGLRVLQTAFPQEAHLWTWAIAGIAVASLAVGNLAALVQRDVKRLLAYSSISHAGFLLIGLSVGSAIGARALLFYGRHGFRPAATLHGLVADGYDEILLRKCPLGEPG